MYFNKRNALQGTIPHSNGKSFFDEESDDGFVISDLQNSSRPYNLYSALERFGETITEENEDLFDDSCSPQESSPFNNDKDKSTLDHSISKKVEKLRFTAKSDNVNVKSVKRCTQEENTETRIGRKENYTVMHNSDKNKVHQNLSCVRRRSSLHDVAQMFPYGCDEYSTYTEKENKMDVNELNRSVKFENSVFQDSQYMKRRSSFNGISQLRASYKDENKNEIRRKSSHLDKSCIDRFSKLNKQSMVKDLKQTKRWSSLDDVNKEKHPNDNNNSEIKDNVISRICHSDDIDSNDIVSISQKSSTNAALRSTKSAINLREFLVNSKLYLVSPEKLMLYCSEGHTKTDKVEIAATGHESIVQIKDNNALQRTQNENKVEKSVHLVEDSCVGEKTELKTGKYSSDIQNKDFNSYENNSVQSKPLEWLAKSKIRQSKREHHMMSPVCF
ncbi:uncharacterized protein LOC134715929 [Mytilus trossulus]|uniref:uncharacterized protein LOC134715925 n=1 Tax=Mytilus trossulus TaxID=6551 RepID=UPI003004B9C8